MIYNWQQVKEIFAAALRENAANRSQFIFQKCAGDKTLLREVESLLESYGSADSFMKTPAISGVAEDFAVESDKLKDGDFLDHYRIIRKIGKGGMGEVYLAQDTKLGRNVAVKILGDYFGNNKANLRRFISEAQTASSLNHPNIVVIHEIGEKDGINYIVSEFIEGLTLTEVLRQKKLTLTQICDISIQIIKALGAAHEVGIIHRDIKPDNIMVRGDGLVKVLDFGLAKLIEKNKKTTDFSEKIREFMTTRAGMILGTVAYMSPEQARGQEVDRRTDIWSFGVLLYQLLTRKLPFPGDTSSDIMAAILKSEPLPLTETAPIVPKKLEWIVRTALMKNPAERFQTVSEVFDELKSFQRGLVNNGNTEPIDFRLSDQIEQDKDTEFRSNRATAEDSVNVESNRNYSFVGRTFSRINSYSPVPLYVLVSCVILLTVGYFGWSKIGSFFTKTDSFQKMKLTKLTFDGRTTQWVTVSPDGKYIGYVLQDGKLPSLMIRQTAASASVELVPPAEVSYWGLTFSPDSNFIYYTVMEKSGSTALFEIPVFGGNPHKILSDITTGATISPDGKKIVFVRNGTTLIIADSNGEEQKVLKNPNPNETRAYLDWSPDGEKILYSAYSKADNITYISEISVADGTERKLPMKPWLRINGLKWLADGSGFLVCGRDSETKFSQIWHASYPNGELRRITNDFSTYVDLSLPADNKSLFAVKQERLFNIWLVPESGVQDAKKITAEEGRDEGMSSVLWTPDNKIIYSVRTAINLELWTVNADGSNNHPLISNNASSFFPSVSSDGKRIVYVSDRSGNLNIWQSDIDGTNAVELVNSSDSESYPNFTPNGKFLIYQRTTPDNKNAVWKLNLETNEHIQLTEAQTTRPVISTDGKFFICEIKEEVSNQPPQLAIFSIDGGKPLKILNLPKVIKSDLYRWSPDGKALFYIEDKNRTFNIWSQPLDMSEPKQLTFFESGEIGKFDFSPDGKTLALARGNETSDIIMISDFK